MSLKKVGPFDIIAPLGQGGMGTVWRARQEPFGRIVALKVLRSANLGDSDAERRFAREVELASALSHPHLVKVLDGGIIDDMSYIAMELVEGDTLLRVIETCQVLPWTHAAALTGRLAAGLAYLHDKNILHRDVKPANALLSFDGWVKLMDFGLAKMKEATVMTADGAVVGTLQFLPPEVIRGAPAAVPGDLWPLGCILYRMVTGRSHIEASSQSGWLQQLTTAEIEPVADLAPDLPAPMAELIMQLLARDPKDRPRSAAEVEERLDDLLAELEDTTWDEVLTPEQTEVLLGKKRPAPPPDERKPSGKLAPPEDVPSLTDPVEESAITAKLPLQRQDSSASSPRQGSSTAAAPRSGATPRQGVRLSGSIKPPPGLRTPSAGVPMPRHSSGKISIRVATPAPPPARRGAAIALACVAGAGLLLFALKRPAPAPAPTPTPSVVEATPSPAATPASGIDAERMQARLTGRGLTYERFLPRLRAGGKGAQRAVEELRALSAITLGDKPCGYVNWIQLEQWFSDPRRAASPPRSPCAQAGPMELLTEKMYLNVLLRAKIEQADAAVTSLALEHVADYPDDGRTWLTLGRLLELDGRPEAARLVYGTALARLEGVELSHKGEFMGAALARAMLMVPGQNLERDFWKHVTDGKEARRALRGLGAALGKEGRDRYEAILRAGLTRPVVGEVAAWVLAEFLEDTRLKPAAARKLATDFLTSTRRGELVLDYLIYHYCQRGLVDEADGAIGLEKRRKWYLAYLDVMRGTRPGDLNFKGLPFPRERFVRWEAWSRLERGDWKQVRTEAETMKGMGHDAFDTARLLFLDVAGRPGADKTLTDQVRDLLIRDPLPADWIEATGALSTPEGRAQMTQLLAQVNHEQKPWFHALWLARCGQHAEALEALAATAAVKATPLIDVGEIACRPLFEAAAGIAIPEPVLERARAATASVPAPVRALHRALASGDGATARKAAWQLFEVYPQRSSPLVAVAWTEAAGGEVAAWPRIRARLLVALRARGHGVWMLDELRAADRIAVGRGATR